MTYDQLFLAFPQVLGYWPMDDVHGHSTVRDEAGGDLGAFPIATDDTQGALGQASILPGATGTCLHKTGSSIHVPASSGAAQAAMDQAGSFCWAGWVQPDAVSGTQNIWGQSGGPRVCLQGTQVKTDGVVSEATSTIVGSGNTCFVAIVYDQVNFSLWFNGVQIASNPFAGPVTWPSANLEIGALTNTSGEFTGYLQKFGWLGYAPSAAEIQNLYVTGIQAGGQLYAYPFSRQIAAQNLHRNAIVITNDSDTNMYLALGESNTVSAVAHQGILVEANGGEWPSTYWKGAIQIVQASSSGNKSVLVEEW